MDSTLTTGTLPAIVVVVVVTFVVVVVAFVVVVVVTASPSTVIVPSVAVLLIVAKLPSARNVEAVSTVTGITVPAASVPRRFTVTVAKRPSSVIWS